MYLFNNVLKNDYLAVPLPCISLNFKDGRITSPLSTFLEKRSPSYYRKFAISRPVRQALLSAAPDWSVTKIWPIRSQAQQSLLRLAQQSFVEPIKKQRLYIFSEESNRSRDLAQQSLLRQAQQILPNLPTNYKIALLS